MTERCIMAIFFKTFFIQVISLIASVRRFKFSFHEHCCLEQTSHGLSNDQHDLMIQCIKCHYICAHECGNLHWHGSKKEPPQLEIHPLTLTFLNPPKSTRQFLSISKDSGNYRPATTTLHGAWSPLNFGS